jgi:hypothetical protein
MAEKAEHLDGAILQRDKETYAIVLTRRCLDYCAANGKKKERTARFIERTGIDAL